MLEKNTKNLFLPGEGFLASAEIAEEFPWNFFSFNFSSILSLKLICLIYIQVKMKSLVWRPRMGASNEYKIFNKIPKNLLFIGILNYTKKKKFHPLSGRIFKSLSLEKFLAEPAENFSSYDYNRLKMTSLIIITKLVKKIPI